MSNLNVYVAPVGTPSPADPDTDPAWTNIIDADLSGEVRRALVVVEDGEVHHRNDVRIEPDGTGLGWRIHMIPVIDPATFRYFFGEDPVS